MKLINTEAIEELCDEMLDKQLLTEQYLSNYDGQTRLQVLFEYKDTICVWGIYLRLALKNENYELAQKIKECMEIEKEYTLTIILHIEGELFEDDYEILEEVIKEIIEIIN